jgi:hypothetical protein
MSFYASNNRIFLTNTGGQIVFDTDWKMPAITNIINGSMNFGTRGNTGQTTVNHFIANVSASPEFVLSTSLITGNSAYPWINTRFNSSGSTLTNLGWSFTNGAWRLGGARTVTFFVSGGQLFIREEYYNQFPTLQLASFSLSYKVYLGSFT